MTRYVWVAARKAEGFPTTMACEVAEVSRQAFYDWKAREAAGEVCLTCCMRRRRNVDGQVEGRATLAAWATAAVIIQSKAGALLQPFPRPRWSLPFGLCG